SFGIWFGNSTVLADVSDNSGSFVVSAGFTPVLGQWYNVGMTFDGSALRLYVNGSQVASGATTKVIAYDTDPLTIGAEYENNSLNYFVSGSIDAALLYNRALTAAEMTTITQYVPVPGTGLTQTAGATTVNGTLVVSSPVTVNGGTLKGSGTIQ